MKDELQKVITEILKEFGVENPKVNFDIPTHTKLGDYTTNVAMAYAKELQKKPLDLALEIKEAITAKQIRHITRIDVIAPGFINFFFDQHYFNKVVGGILGDNNFGHSKHAVGYKVLVEHTQPNPFKAFHIGHLMNNTIGESVTRIIRANGAEVKTCTYHGDVGMHIAKAVWAIEKGSSMKDAYAVGNAAFENDPNSKQQITELNKKIYERTDEAVNSIYDSGKKESLDYFEEWYKKLDNHFDFHFYESESGPIGKKLVQDNIGKVFEVGDGGAVVFKGENFGLHTRVFLNSEGLPTYEAKEVGLAQIKKDKFAYDGSITITANEQDAFFKVVEVAIGEVFPDRKGKLKHLSHGLLKLPSGKMSSRTGTIISAEDLINQVRGKVLDLMKEANVLDPGKKDIDLEIAEDIALSAIKYSILRQAIGGDIIFDFDKSISFMGDSGPYLLYAVVRGNSLLKKAEGVVDLSDEIPENWQTTNLERYLERFPGIVARAGMEYAPHHIVTYLIELAGEFNSFYADHKIIDAEDKTSPYRLALTKAFTQVMTSGLDLLGIKVPSQM